MSGDIYRMHGLTVWSDVDLHGARTDTGPPDLAIVRGPTREIPDEVPPGRIIAERSGSDRRFYTATIGESGPIVRFHRLCDFVFSPDLRQITWHAAPDASDEIVGVMAAGTVLSVALILRGHLVLHASAVRIAGAALAIVGQSGMGKSTLATVLCAGGAELVTDDVLRVDGDGCHCGSREVRLRPQAQILGDAAEGRSRTTADGRLAITLPPAGGGWMPLQAVVVPAINKEGLPVVGERIPPGRSVLTLAAFPRVENWQDPASQSHQFELLADLAMRVPVWQCRIPWGPPFRETLAAEILEAIHWRSPLK